MVLALELPGIPRGTLKIEVILTVINFFFQVLWQIFFGFAVIMFLVAGFMFLAGRGEVEKIKKAKDAVVWGIIGVIVGIIAFSIPLIIQNQILRQ